KLALNGINLINYLARGDLDGAKIEAKRFSVMRQYLLDYDPEHAHGAFGSYLAGFVAERQGNADEALRYYDEALQERELPTLQGPIQRLGQRGSYRTERLDRYLPQAGGPQAGGMPAPSEPQAQDVRPAEILVIVKTGRVPYRVPVRLPIGAAV